MSVRVTIIFDDSITDEELAALEKRCNVPITVARQDHFAACWSWSGRGGDLESSYIVNDFGAQVLAAITAKGVYLGEVLGKHSEFVCEPGEMVFEMKPAWSIETDILGCSWVSGQDPVCTLVEEFQWSDAHPGTWRDPIDPAGFLAWLKEKA